MKYLILLFLLSSTMAFAVEPPKEYMGLDACDRVLQENPNPFFPRGKCTLSQLVEFAEGDKVWTQNKGEWVLQTTAADGTLKMYAFKSDGKNVRIQKAIQRFMNENGQFEYMPLKELTINLDWIFGVMMKKQGK